MHVRIRIKDTFTLISTNRCRYVPVQTLCASRYSRDVPRTGKRRSAERQETFRGKARDGNAEVSCAEFVGFVKFLVICTVFRLVIHFYVL